MRAGRQSRLEELPVNGRDECGVQRQVLHVDVVAFAVAVERVVDPGLNGRPVVVAPPGGTRSLVTVASLEARQEGIRPGMPLTRAVRRCRGLVVLPPNPPLYERATRALTVLYEGYSPVVEPGGCGRSYLDLTGTERLFGPARDTAFRIQKAIRNDLRLWATLGVGSNKMVSKVASDVIAPPPGVENVAAGYEERFLAPLPVGLLPGVGERVLEGLCDFNVRLVGELARIPVRHLVLGFGRLGFTLSRKARGIDPTPVHPPNKRPALKEEEQFPSDTNDYPELVDALYRLVERGGRRLRRSGRVTGKLSLHLRYADYREARGSVRLSTEADLDPVLFDAARPLFDKLLERRIRIRHLALVLENLADAPAQLSLFPSDAPTKAASLVSALDCIRMKYGDSAVVKGSAMRKRPKKQREDAELQSGGERLNAEAQRARHKTQGTMCRAGKMKRAKLLPHLFFALCAFATLRLCVDFPFS